MSPAPAPSSDTALDKFPEQSPRSAAIFGGVIDPTKLRFPFKRLPANDARDWEAIACWADEIAAAYAGGIVGAYV
jgi:menaquinone-dependent protoporphyrinogen IX oxidase